MQKEKLADRYTTEERAVEGGPYQKALEDLEKSRPAFIVEPQVLLLSVSVMNLPLYTSFLLLYLLPSSLPTPYCLATYCLFVYLLFKCLSVSAFVVFSRI